MPIVPPVANDTISKSVEAANSRGKEAINEQDQTKKLKKDVSLEEGQEFLRLIKKRDFKILDQLEQTPFKISILSLLLSYEAHRKPLMKVLSATHVMHDITVDQFDNVVVNITSCQYLDFNEAELLADGIAHNKALHISVTCMDTLSSRVLVDTGSSLNMIRNNTLSQLLVEGSDMRASALVVRAFNDSRRQVIGEVDLLVRIGPDLFTISFQVRNIKPAYIYLLGRP